MGPNSDQALAQRAHSRLQCPRHMSNALINGSGVASIDQVGNRLSLRQIDAAVDERAAAEFARICNPSAFSGSQSNYFAYEVDTPVAMQFGNVLAGRTSGPRHDNTHCTIE